MPEGTRAHLRVEPLHLGHDRAAFSCGVESLDLYLRLEAGQDMRRKVNAVFVLVELADRTRVLGYFTLWSTVLPPGYALEEVHRSVSRDPVVSVAHLRRLAVARECQGHGLGGILLANALRRACRAAGDVGSSMVVADAIDERAASFYAAHGFVRLPGSMRLILPMQLVGGMVDGR